MKILNTFQFQGYEALLWPMAIFLLAIFLLVIMAAGRDKKGTAIQLLQKKKTVASADTFGFLCRQG